VSGRSTIKVPAFKRFTSASARASAAARGSSRKRDTRCELVLRRALWARALRYRVDVRGLPGKPDIVLTKPKLAIFCDGDFWHGRNLEERLKHLEVGHNSAYWVAKIQRNVERDRRNDAELRVAGWLVLRLWETDILKDPQAAAQRVLEAVHRARPVRSAPIG
jgi:DNA mismatch endonuclease (patch repair protein)